MIEIETTTQKWGNGLRVIFPDDAVQEGHIKENEKIHLFIAKKQQTPKKIFGMLKGKIGKSTQQIKDELRE